jgi:ribosome-associated protein
VRPPAVVGTLDPSNIDSRSRTLTTSDTSEPRALALAAAEAAASKKATEIRILELGSLLGITDYFVLASATNERQLGTVVREIERQLKAGGTAPRRREGTKDTGWMVLDYGDIVVHAFTVEQRRYYDLERLWSDAPIVPLADAFADGGKLEPDARVAAGAAAPDGE